MTSMLLRIVLAMLMGGVIGLDREKKHRPAGFRTYMLVALGASVTMILSQYMNLMLFSELRDAYEVVGQRTDVVRFGAQVINGIGFIGTGTILVTAHSEVKGLTTASCLWASACMGLAVGAGFYECVLVSFILILLCMKFLPMVEKAILNNARNMNIYIEMDSIENMADIVNRMKAKGISFYDVDLSREKNELTAAKVSALFMIRLPRRMHHTDVLARLSTLDGIVAIKET